LQLAGVTGQYLKGSKHITQARLGWFVDEQRSKVGDGKGGILGEP
jgi:hypothetical protein